MVEACARERLVGTRTSACSERRASVANIAHEWLGSVRSICNAVDVSTEKRTSGSDDTKRTSRVIRVNVSPATWRQLRMRAIEEDTSLSDLLGAVLEREAKKRDR